MSHTPGPWGWTYDGSSSYSIGRADDPQVLPIANVHSRDFIVATGNCNLIVAAPDMLAALKRVRDEVSEGELDRSTLTTAIDVAIAKAEGW